MKKEDLQNIDISEITEEEARIYSIDVIQGTIDKTKVKAIREGFATAVLLAGSVVLSSTTGGVASYALWGLDSYFFSRVVEKIAKIRQNKKYLNKFKEDTYEDSYKEFLRLCQEYNNKKETPEKGMSR